MKIFLQEQPHLDDIGSASIFRADGWNGDRLSQSFDEALGELVNLLEIGLQLRSHVALRAVEIGPVGDLAREAVIGITCSI